MKTKDAVTVPEKNGNGNGNDPFPYEFQCKDTGIVLHLRKVPFTTTALLHTQYEKEFPPPKPPTNKVDYGDGETIDEPNVAHPAYVKLLKEYEAARLTWVNHRAMHLFAEYAIQCEVDADAVRELRATMQAQGVTLDPDDKFVYIWNIAVGTGEGYGELFAAIQRRSQVTEGAVADALQRFQSSVQAP